MQDPPDNGSLFALEHLMDEFFNPHTSNRRKHDIEIQLNYFKSLPHLWRYCIYFITNTSSQYVKMFALSTLESVINQQWDNIDWSSKEEIKNVLQNFLVENGHSSPHFFRTKYAKLLVDIAKHDWPLRYPNFFDNVLELLKSEASQLMGLILLKTCSEEFMGIQATFTDGTRKDEVTRLLQQYIPIVFQMLTNILENLGSKPRHTSTATPPPSPAHPSSSPTLSQHLVTSAFRPDTKMLTKQALETVQHLFTWAPIQRIPSQIISAIFSFTNVSSYSQDDDDMCVLALSTINELLYRKCTPPHTQPFYFQLYHQIEDLLKDITSSSNRIDSLDPIFMEKLSELLVLLIEHHLWKLESEPGFTALGFLSPLFQLTMQLPTVRCYLCCTTVWVSFVKQLKPENAKKYSDVFVTLVTALLKKIQFTCNFSQLNCINEVDLDEDNETEWQIFLKTTIEVIAVIAEYAQDETFGLVLSPWIVSFDMFRSLDASLGYQNHCLKLELSESRRLCYVFKDFSSLTQMLTRLSSIYVDQNGNEAVITVMNSVLEKILESASLANKPKFNELILRENDSKLSTNFIELNSQLLSAIKTLLTHFTHKNLNNHIVKTVLDITLPVLRDIGNTADGKVRHSAALLLLTLTDLMFPPNLIIIPGVVQFIHAAPNLKFFDKQTNCIVNNAVSNMLLKPWGELNQEDSTQRNHFVGAFFEHLTKDFRELASDAREDRIQGVVESVLPSLSVIIQSCRHFPISSKKLVTIALKPTIQHGLFMFPSLVRCKEISNHVLTFFLDVMGVLQQQLGVDEIKSAVQVFMQATMNERQASSLCGLDKLLQILQLVVEAPGSNHKIFLPGILQLCMETIYPSVVSHGGDVFVALLTLLYSILLHRWQYFYVSQVRLGYSPGCSDSDPGAERPQQPEQLLAVLQVFGQALLQHDINIFRISLAALEDLNSKWKLYHKMLFRCRLLSEFLSVLLNCLLDKSQSSLSEDIQMAVYNMAAVNFDEFCTFLGKFVESVDGVSHQQREVLLRNFQHNHDTDMPTFVHNLQNFITEARHYRICNISR
ncbi:exportin-6-like isoform X1 [Diorhabda sublineata]|uniref:exportin-6-like isoform X1 n=1 Tax=Diorhabda sublineata TaxID=1163346 RepID=UPI0024E0514E|nr:exportin-6-like isoform X1 [Diorhabda sublineata]